jgi:hypothetical protein
MGSIERLHVVVPCLMMPAAEVGKAKIAAIARTTAEVAARCVIRRVNTTCSGEGVRAACGYIGNARGLYSPTSPLRTIRG